MHLYRNTNDKKDPYYKEDYYNEPARAPGSPSQPGSDLEDLSNVSNNDINPPILIARYLRFGLGKTI